MTYISSLILGIYAVSATAVPQMQPRPATASAASSTASYDYIIIGGGTAGLVMASRLSENASVSVAVIEAGGNPEEIDPNFRKTPALDGDGIGADPSSTNGIDWNFVTAPQKGANNRRLHYARGKCLGGTYDHPLYSTLFHDMTELSYSSVRNYMMYQRYLLSRYVFGKLLTVK